MYGAPMGMRLFFNCCTFKGLIGNNYQRGANDEGGLGVSPHPVLSPECDSILYTSNADFFSPKIGHIGPNVLHDAEGEGMSL